MAKATRTETATEPEFVSTTEPPTEPTPDLSVSLESGLMERIRQVTEREQECERREKEMVSREAEVARRERLAAAPIMVFDPSAPFVLTRAEIEAIDFVRGESRRSAAVLKMRLTGEATKFECDRMPSDRDVSNALSYAASLKDIGARIEFIRGALARRAAIDSRQK